MSRWKHISTMVVINIRLRDQVLQHLRQDEFYGEISHTLLRDSQDPRYRDFRTKEDGLLSYGGRMYIPKAPEIWRMIFKKFHSTPHSEHPEVTKMMADIKPLYFWKGMKREILDYVARCLECQRVKAECHYPTGLLYLNEVPEWMWQTITMDFIQELPMTWSKHHSSSGRQTSQGGSLHTW